MASKYLVHTHFDVVRQVDYTQFWEYEYHTLIQCPSFDHTKLFFPNIFDQIQPLHKILSQSHLALSIVTIINKVLQH